MKLEKITKQSGRVYNDACGTAHGLELIGERWALLVVRELMLGPKRFGDLRASLPGLSANVLTQRLEGLEADNSNALDRAIVMHAADYARPEHVDRWGRLGRSNGCLAMAPDDFMWALTRLSGGRLIYADRLGLG